MQATQWIQLIWSTQASEWKRNGVVVEQQFTWWKCLVEVKNLTMTRLSTLRSFQLKTWNWGSSNWRTDEWKNIATCDRSWILLQHLDCRVRIWREQHGSMDPSSLVSKGQAGCYNVTVWKIFSHTLILILIFLILLASQYQISLF